MVLQVQRPPLVRGEREVRVTIAALATDGYGASPSSAATAPSCAWPSRESVGSSQWSASLSGP
jgi:hypothetical protein